MRESMKKVTATLDKGSELDLILLIISFITLCYAIFVHLEGDPLALFTNEQSKIIYLVSFVVLIVYFTLNKRRKRIDVTLVENQDEHILVQRLGYVPFSGYTIKNKVSIEKAVLKELLVSRFATISPFGPFLLKTNAVSIIFLATGMRGFGFELKDRDVVSNLVEFITLNAPSVKVVKTLV